MSKGKESSECQGLETIRKELSLSDRMNELEDGISIDVYNDLIRAKLQAIDMPIPTELDEFIQTGLAKGVKVQKTRRFRKWSALAACLFLAVFITSVRVSPAVANVLHQIPGLGYIVELINYDKGLQSAVENDFILPLGVSDEHEAIVFTVDGIIMDEGSLIIFYTVDNQRGEGSFELSEVKLFDEMGEPLQQISLSYSSIADPDQDGKNKVHSQININFNDKTVIPNGINLKVKLRDTIQDMPDESFTQLPSVWEAAIPVNKEMFAGMKTVYEVNQNVVIEGQKIIFEKLTVYPTRMALSVAYDPANSKKIFAFDDLTLVNEKGEEWGRISNGMTGSKPDEYHEILFFQSNYFTQPQKLYLQGKSIRALDKVKARVILDLEQEKIIESPPDLVLDRVIKNYSGKPTEVDFLLITNPDFDKLHGFSVLSFEFTDNRGDSFSVSEQGVSIFSNIPEYDQTLSISLPDKQDYQSPLTFQIQDFPSRITGEFNIRIK